MAQQLKNYTKMEKLNQWIDQLIFPGESKNFIQELESHSIPGKEVIRKFCFYTENNVYFIVGIDRTENEGYLGCQVQCRKPRAGEGWLRGNDLPFGKFTKATWDIIEKAILNYELVKLTKYLKPETGDLPYDDT